MDWTSLSDMFSLILGFAVIIFVCYFLFFRPLKKLFTDRGNRLYWLLAILGSIWLIVGIALIDWLGKNFETGQTIGAVLYFGVIAAVVIPLTVREIRGRKE
ncbi:hypothetical protein [Bacillus sinesaloumensis]|uniref:hypothetical protein n=1 Tax=Litchfieldia sinesaloumensis TaxID=1926280 RepID=UPI0009888642|nr:hypothetical protein [Bacillus sinesaloumensis]